MSLLGDSAKGASLTQGKGEEDMQAAEVLLGLFEGSDTSGDEAKVGRCGWFSLRNAFKSIIKIQLCLCDGFHRVPVRGFLNPMD